MFLMAATLLVPAPAAAQLSGAERAALADLGPTYAQRFELRRGWFRGRPIQYFDIGPVPVTLAPMFVFVTGFGADGHPQLAEGQHPVVGSLPGLDGYSGIWQVHFVVVRPGWVPNTVRDARQAVAMSLRGEARLVIPGFYVNCPVVPQGSQLAGDPANRPLRPAWYKGQEVGCFDFGRTPLAPAPIYGFITGLADGEPQFVRGQANVVDVAPDSGGYYADMWDVHFVTVPSAYTPDTLRDLATLQAEAAAGRLTIQRAGSVRNCPVVLVDGRLAERLSLTPLAQTAQTP